MELTHVQKLALFDRGYVKVPGVVPRVMVDAALRAINHSVGEGMNVEEMVRFRAQSFCPELTKTPVITDLINRTPALELAESAVGVGKIRPVGGDSSLTVFYPGINKLFVYQNPFVGLPTWNCAYSIQLSTPGGKVERQACPRQF